MSNKIYRVAGYVKLAKLWERKKEQAITYHNSYYVEKFNDISQFMLTGVYIDITGKKPILKRENMMNLLKECLEGRVDCIATQTKAYLAADAREFCYLIKLLFDKGVELITEDVDYHINTIANNENQKEELYKMAESYIALNPEDFYKWQKKILFALGKEET